MKIVFVCLCCLNSFGYFILLHPITDLFSCWGVVKHSFFVFSSWFFFWWCLFFSFFLFLFFCLFVCLGVLFLFLFFCCCFCFLFLYFCVCVWGFFSWGRCVCLFWFFIVFVMFPFCLSGVYVCFLFVVLNVLISFSERYRLHIIFCNFIRTYFKQIK